jgi:transcriptional regulator with XRE-family HTH domain
MMAIPVDDILKRLPPEEQAAIAARARELIAEYLTLQDLRKARELTQERLAELLGIKQENVSRLEKRSDLLLSTLMSYVAAMGGRLRLVAEFPDRPPVELAGLGSTSTEPAPSRSRREAILASRIEEARP